MNRLVLLIILAGLFSCKQDSVKTLPKIGNPKVVDGKEVPHFIPDFEFYNQDSVKVTQDDLKDYIYLADFFFTSCPSICPKVTKQMLRLYEKYKDNPKVKLVCFTLDPKRDTPERLKLYAHNLEVDTDKWMFLRGDKDVTYDLANEFFVVAYEDESVPGGFDHSGKILLVDQNKNIRAFAEGTDPESVDKLLKDVDILLKEISSEGN